MRILLLTSAFPPTAGGAETYASNLALGLGARGHAIAVVTSPIVGQPSLSKLSSNVAVFRLESFRQRLSSFDRLLWEELQFCLLPEVELIAQEFGPDLVFSNNLGLCPLAKMLSLGLQKPWIATFHEQSPEREPLGEARLHLAYRVLKPDMVIAGSQFYLARALRYGKAEATQLIYHGVDLNQFKELPTEREIRSRYGVPERSALLVSAGRLKLRKGLLELIRATDLLRAKGHEVFVVIAGSISSASIQYREQLRDLVTKLGLSSNVAFEEDLAHSGMPALLSAADIVVQPSFEEGLGLAVIEAMACARPVVATRIPGIQEIITNDDVAVLIEPGSPVDIAGAVESLLSDSDRRRAMGKRARTHVAEHFSLDRMVASTCDLLEGLTRHSSE